ncbi:flagellar protein FliT [Clostridium novyi]|uniref:flagellar protein FliT n=1 Tax=Clostridium novyi TaxID=1542 RepID=UPI000689C687|nr:flagellar protein FliT [Clostridium novyi]
MLYDVLKSYRDLNIGIINALNEDKLDLVEELLAKKDNLIEKIQSMNYEKEEFLKISNELKVMDSEKTLSDLTLAKKNQYKNEMNKITKNKNANRMYTNTRKNIYLEKFI